jgi:hypothetical protein
MLPDKSRQLGNAPATNKQQGAEPAGSIEVEEMAAYGALQPMGDDAAYGWKCPISTTA